MLKFKVTTLDGISEEHQKLYKKLDDGTFQLEVEGADSKEKTSEFRENNIQLKAKLEELEKNTKTSQEQMEALNKQLEEKTKKLDEIGDKKLLDEGNVEELLNQRVERMRQDFTTQTEKMTKALEEKDSLIGKLSSKLNEAVINNTISTAITDVGVPRKGAMTDIMQRAQATWQVDENGNMVAKNADGSPIFGTDGKAPLTTAEWAKSLQTDAPFLFEPNSGGGAAGGGGQNNPPADGVKSIKRGDKAAFAANIDKIASGEVKVVAE